MLPNISNNSLRNYSSHLTDEESRVRGVQLLASDHATTKRRDGDLAQRSPAQSRHRQPLLRALNERRLTELCGVPAPGTHSVSVSPCHWQQFCNRRSTTNCGSRSHSSRVAGTGSLGSADCPGSQERADETGTVLGTGLSGGVTDTNRTLALSTDGPEREHRR